MSPAVGCAHVVAPRSCSSGGGAPGPGPWTRFGQHGLTRRAAPIMMCSRPVVAGSTAGCALDVLHRRVAPSARPQPCGPAAGGAEVHYHVAPAAGWRPVEPGWVPRPAAARAVYGSVSCSSRGWRPLEPGWVPWPTRTAARVAYGSESGHQVQSARVAW